MFTVLWKIDSDQEEIYATPAVAKIPAAERLSDELDCCGRAHLSFQVLTPVDDGSAALRLLRRVIDAGEVFVMNAEGKTVAMYRFAAENRRALAA